MPFKFDSLTYDINSVVISGWLSNLMVIYFWFLYIDSVTRKEVHEEVKD